MGRKVAIFWHALVSILAGAAYYFVVLPRPFELVGRISHAGGIAGRIGCGILIGLAALPVVFTLLRTRDLEPATLQPARTLRVAAIVAHLLAAVLIVGTSIAEIWLSLDRAGPWLFGVYAAAAAVAVLGMLAFYLSFVAELPPRLPKPPRTKKDKQKSATAQPDEATAVDETEPAATTETDAEPETVEAEADEAEADEAEAAEAKPDDATAAELPASDTAQTPETELDDLPTAEDTVAVEPPRGGLRNRRPSGKSRHRRPRGGVAVDGD